MGFKEVKHKVISDLLAGDFQHEGRNDINEKNLLATGRATPQEIAGLLKASRGPECTSSPHHQDGKITVYVVATRGWYVKFYFYPDTLFISVHRTS